MKRKPGSIKGTKWFVADLLALILGVAILISADYRLVPLNMTEQLIDIIVMILMFIAVGAGVFCLYVRRHKQIALIGVFAGFIGLFLSLILAIPSIEGL